jgi:hypothetical protein
MSNPSDEYRVGYGRPPKHTQWKPRESGNPKRRYRARTYNTVEMIDQLFQSPIEIAISGELNKVSTLEAIILQLWLKEVSGNRAALNTRLKYQEFSIQTSERKVQITFVDSDYTQALAEGMDNG